MPMKVLGIVLCVLLVLLAGLNSSRAQTTSPDTVRRVVVRAGLDAIDNGLTLDAPASLAWQMAQPDDARPYVPGRVIVKLRDNFPSAMLAATADSVGGVPAGPLSHANFRVLSIGADEDPERAAALLAQRPEVEYAQAAYRAQFHFVPNDPLYRSQWNFPAIDMERAWDINPGATSDVIVAVLDSGVAFENAVVQYDTLPILVGLPGGGTQLIQHGRISVPYAAAPDLVGPGRIVAPFDFTWNDTHPFDTLGHGTHVAGTIGQLTNNGVGAAGMAFNVRIMPVKVAAGGPWDFVFRAPSATFTDDQIARAIRYAADNGAKAINMSFGRSGAPAPVVEDAVRYAVSRGAFCVFSAGNSALVGSPPERYAEIATRVNGAVAVGAIGPSRDRARYSSIGSWVELSAPGGDTFMTGITGGIVQQTLDMAFFASPLVPPRFDVMTYSYQQGTSMAAPHVTGFAALLVQQGITSPAAIEAAMKRYATDRGAAGPDNEYGAGIINPRATLRGLGLAK
jgi:serine protease